MTRNEIIDKIVRMAEDVRKHRLCHCTECTRYKEDILMYAKWLKEGNFTEE